MFRVNNLNDVICKRTNFLNCFYQKGKKFTAQQSKLDLSKFNSGLAFPLRLFAFALLLTEQGIKAYLPMMPWDRRWTCLSNRNTVSLWVRYLLTSFSQRVFHKNVLSMVFQEIVAYLKLFWEVTLLAAKTQTTRKKATVLIRKTKALSLHHFCGKFLRLYCTTYIVKINLIGIQCDHRFNL